MSAPIALLTRSSRGLLRAVQPIRLPCEDCRDGYLCGPYPCPKLGLEDIATAALEAAKE